MDGASLHAGVGAPIPVRAQRHEGCPGGSICSRLPSAGVTLSRTPVGNGTKRDLRCFLPPRENDRGAHVVSACSAGARPRTCRSPWRSCEAPADSLREASRPAQLPAISMSALSVLARTEDGRLASRRRRRGPSCASGRGADLVEKDGPARRRRSEEARVSLDGARNAPRSWPKSSLRSSSRVRPPQLTASNRPCAARSAGGSRRPPAPCPCRTRPGSGRGRRGGRLVRSA